MFCEIRNKLRKNKYAANPSLTCVNKFNSFLTLIEISINMLISHLLYSNTGVYGNLDVIGRERNRQTAGQPDSRTWAGELCFPQQQILRYTFTLQQMSVAESPCSSYETDQGSTSTLRPRLLPRKRKSTCFRKMVRYIAKGYLTRESDRQYYADRYRCCPPPLFIPTITLAEASQYITVYKQNWLQLLESILT